MSQDWTLKLKGNSKFMGCIQNIVSSTWSLLKSAGTQSSRIHLAAKDETAISESQCNWFGSHLYPSCTLSTLITVVLFWTLSKFSLSQPLSPHPICFFLFDPCSSCTLPSSHLYSTLIPAVLYPHSSCTLPSSQLYSLFDFTPNHSFFDPSSHYVYLQTISVYFEENSK